MVVEDHSFSCWQYLCTDKQLNSDVVVAVGILVLFSVVGVVGIWAVFEAPSEVVLGEPFFPTIARFA